MPTQPEENFDPSHITSLSRMLDLEATSHSGAWSPADFPAILDHQLAASLESELAGMDFGLSLKLEAWRRQSDHRLESFADLLTHPRPPLELLETVKQFAKRHRSSQDATLPPEIATALYFACIAIGLTRLGRRITRIDDDALRGGVRWALDQQWIGEPVRWVLHEAEALLGAADG